MVWSVGFSPGYAVQPSEMSVSIGSAFDLVLYRAGAYIKQPLPLLLLAFIPSNGQHKGKELTLRVHTDTHKHTLGSSVPGPHTVELIPGKTKHKNGFHLYAGAFMKKTGEERTWRKEKKRRKN